jgi:ABC-type branched-subunit amino acid transport system substrate-binding protein
MVTFELFLFIAVDMLLSVTIAAPPSIVRFGIMSAMHSTDYTPDTGTQFVGAMRMAIKEINARTDLLPDTMILFAYEDSQLDPGVAFFSSLRLSTSAFNNTPVDIVLGPETSGEAEATALVLKEFSIPQISMSATSPDLSSKKNYPFFSRVCPSDAFQGRAMADLVRRKYRWYDNT